MTDDRSPPDELPSSILDPLDDPLPDWLAASAVPRSDLTAAEHRDIYRMVMDAQLEALSGDYPDEDAATIEARLLAGRVAAPRLPTLDEALTSILDPLRLAGDRLRRERTKARRAVREAQFAADQASAPFVAWRERREAGVSAGREPSAALMARSLRCQERLRDAKAAVVPIDAQLAAHAAHVDRCREALSPIVAATLAGEATGWRYHRGRLIDAKGRDFRIETLSGAAALK